MKINLDFISEVKINYTYTHTHTQLAHTCTHMHAHTQSHTHTCTHTHLSSFFVTRLVSSPGKTLYMSDASNVCLLPFLKNPLSHLQNHNFILNTMKMANVLMEDINVH